MSDVKISKIIIEIGKNKFDLSPEEAKELQEMLNDTFGKREIIFPPTTYPIIIEHPYPAYRWKYWRPYWDNTGTTLTYSNTSYSNHT